MVKEKICKKVNELNYILTILNLMYPFNNLVGFIKEYQFDKKIKVTKQRLFLKYPSWEYIYTILDYFVIFIDNDNKSTYLNFIETYKTDSNLRNYYENLIYS